MGQQGSKESRELSGEMGKLRPSVWGESAEGQGVRGAGEGNWLDVRKGVSGWRVRKVIPRRRGI